MGGLLGCVCRGLAISDCTGNKEVNNLTVLSAQVMVRESECSCNCPRLIVFQWPCNLMSHEVRS